VSKSTCLTHCSIIFSVHYIYTTKTENYQWQIVFSSFSRLKISYSGTLAFEDLWPKLGDYDMNDVMVKYTSTMTRNALDNRIYEIEDKFILQHCGGYLQNGFGYQLHKLSNSNVKSVKITGPDASGLSSSIYMEGKETEPRQSHPTILLYDDMESHILFH
jgi:LruC domain-containing protein